ncbi:unnamed protein product [Urochloa humidicola]
MLAAAVPTSRSRVTNRPLTTSREGESHMGAVAAPPVLASTGAAGNAATSLSAAGSRRCREALIRQVPSLKRAVAAAACSVFSAISSFYSSAAACQLEELKRLQ